jgi:glycosyltransferase involved in cell wall biosynthesis
VKKKILHIIPRSSYDGASISAFRIAKNLTEYSHTVLAGYRGNAFDEFLENKVNCYNLSGSVKINFYTKINTLLRFILFLFKYKFDIIQYHQGGISFLVFSIIFSKSAKVIFYIHSSILSGDNFAKMPSFKHKILLKFIDKKIVKIASSQSAYDTYLKTVPGAKDLFIIKNSYSGKYIKKTNINYKVGYLGRICLEKGVKDFLRVIDSCDSANNITFYAKGDVYENIQGELDNNPGRNLIILPPSLNVEEYLNYIDLLIFPSQIVSEALPLVMLEALFNDVGVLCYDTRANREVLGDYPLICKKNKPELMNVLINQFYKNADFREEISQCNWKASEKFSSENQFSKLDQLFLTF